GIDDSADNCSMRHNPDQVDTDNDGFGNACDADFNQDAMVDFHDVSMMRAMYDSASALGDLNNDGWVDIVDLNIMKSLFLTAPGPSGMVN
ncbi:MAG: hypothetical protein OEQ74_01740, partial [Gammaproteobacteria bacterium]|nr:hypothetical protein [Gammaproteobacteria bacterium]